MRHGVTRLILAATLVVTSWLTSAEAGFYSLPRSLKSVTQQVAFGEPTLAPMAHTFFCIQTPRDCEVKRMAFRGGRPKLTEQRWDELVQVNRDVNKSIKPERNTEGLRGERWLVAPAAGDCNDYAVTKRHELLKRGWASRSLLLAEVVTQSGEHHLVLVVRTRDGDVVLDNLSWTIRPWSKTKYQWVRIQSPRNPKFWSTVATASV